MFTVYSRHLTVSTTREKTESKNSGNVKNDFKHIVLVLIFCLCYRWPAWWAFVLLVAWLCSTYYVVITCFVCLL